MIARSGGPVPATKTVALFGDGHGSFSEVASDPTPSARDVAAGDLDGDGVAELLVAAGSAVRVYSAAAFVLDLRASVSFAAEVNRVVPLTIESGLPHLLVATADGRARLVARTEAGGFEEQSSIAGGSAAGDVDGDGRVDLVWLRDHEIAVARGATVARARVSRPGRTSGRAVVSAEYTGDTVFAPSVGTLEYTVEAHTPTSFTIEASPPQSKTGESVTLAATVDLPSSDVPTLVLFASDRSGVLGTAVVSGGFASLQTNALRGGVNVITGNLVGGSAGLATTTHTVTKSAGIVLLRSSRNPVPVGTPVTYVASVHSKPLAPFVATGTVSFFQRPERGETLLATVPLTGGVATFSTDLLSWGDHQIIARYSGDESLLPGSAAIAQGILDRGTDCVITSSSPNPSIAGQTVLVRTICHGRGQINIKEGNTTLATVTVPQRSGERLMTETTASIVLDTSGVHTIAVHWFGSAPLHSYQHVVTERAPVLEVTTLADAGGGSLRQAIADAGDGAEIRFSVAGTIELATLIEIRGKRIAIDGPGSEQLVISGRGQHRHFFITTSNGKADGTPASVTIRGLTLRDGFSRGGNGGGGGGAGLGGSLLVDNPGGQVRLEHIVFRGNRVQGGKGGDGAGLQRANDSVRDMWGNPGGGGGGIDGNDGGTAELNMEFGQPGRGGHGGVLGGIGGCFRNCTLNNPTGNISAGGASAGGKGGFQLNDPNSQLPGLHLFFGETSGSGGFGGGSGGGLSLRANPRVMPDSPLADKTDPSIGGFGGGGGGTSYKWHWTSPAGYWGNLPDYPPPTPGSYGGAGSEDGGDYCSLTFWERFAGRTCDGAPHGQNLYSGGGGGGGAGLGGAVFVKAGEIAIADSTFIQNSAIGGAGGATENGAPGSQGQGKGAAVFVHPDGRLALGGGNTWLANVASHAFFGTFCPNGLPDLAAVCAPAAIGGIFVESGDDQSVFPGGTFPPVVIRVTGAGGEPQSTSLTLTLPSHFATIDGQATATMTTGADGRATFSPIVARHAMGRFPGRLTAGAASADVWFTVVAGRSDSVSVRVVEATPSLASRVSSFAVTVARGAAGATGSITVLDGTAVLAAHTRVQDDATVFSRMLGHGWRRVRAVYSGDDGQPPTVSPIWWHRVLAEPAHDLQRARTINLGPGLGPLALGQTRNGPIEVLAGHADAVESLDESFGLQRRGAAPLARPAAGLAVADFTGDGRGDVAVTTGSASAPGTLAILSRDQWGVAFGATVVATGQAGGPVAASDVDLDGRADIVTGAPLTLYRQRPDGTFEARVLGGTYRDVALAFMDSDDWPDIVALDAESITIIPGGLQARFGEPIVTALGAGANAAAIDIGDLNDDGAADVVVATPGLADGGISVCIGVGDGTLEPRRAFAPSIAVADVAIADVGGDGRLDVVAADRTNKKVVVFHGAGNGQLGNQRGYELPAAPRAIAAMDVTRDGGTDVIATLDNGSVALLPALTGELLGFPPPRPGSGAPSITGPDQITIAEDSVTPPLSFSVGDADTPLDQLVVSVDTSNPALVPSGQLLLAGEGATRSITVMPAADRFGMATITIAVSDGTATATHAFAVNVTPVNDAPSISAIGPVTTNLSTPTPPIAFSLSDVDTPGEMLSLTATATPPLVAPNGFVFSGNGASRSLVLTPAEGAAGVTMVTIVVSDGAAASSTSFELRIGTSGPPGTPRNFRVRAVADGVLMTWDASDEGAPATQFVLEGARMPDAAPLPVIAIDAASREYRLPLPAGDYAFRLRAANGAGVSDPTETLLVAVAAAGDIPGPPSALRVQVDGTHVTASWNPPVMGPAPTGYRIELGTAPGSSDRGVVDLDSTATQVAAPLAAGSYALRVRVRARVGELVGAPSNDAAFSVDPIGCVAAPPAPVLLPASVAGLDVVLTWTGDNAPGDTYALGVGSAPGLSDLALFDTRSTARAFVARAPAPGVYYVFVVARNACGTSLPSTVGAVVVGTPPSGAAQ